MGRYRAFKYAFAKAVNSRSKRCRRRWCALSVCLLLPPGRPFASSIAATPAAGNKEKSEKNVYMRKKWVVFLLLKPNEW
jgi:hypothetical protein